MTFFAARPEPVSATAHDPPPPDALAAGRARRARRSCLRLSRLPSVVVAMLDPGIGVPTEPAGPSISAGTAALSLALVGVGALSALAEWHGWAAGPSRLARTCGSACSPMPSTSTALRPQHSSDPSTALSRLVVAGDRDVVPQVRGTGSAVRALGRRAAAAQAGNVSDLPDRGLASSSCSSLAGAGAAWW